MCRLFPILIALALLAGISAVPSGAASFDCRKAKAPDEVAVCADRELSELDTEMGALWFAYDAFPFLMGMSGNRQDEAHAFLDKRARCGADVSCLRNAYRARIKALKQDIKWAMSNYCGAATGQ